MPTRRLPNRTPSILRTLTTARDQWLSIPVAAERAISAEQWSQLDPAQPASFLNRFLKEASDVDLAEAAQAPLTSALSRSAARLAMYVSHFHQVLDLGILRGDFQSGARGYYGRDIGASTIPDLSSYRAVHEAAGHVVNGEAARRTAEAGAHLAMALPSAADVAGLLSAFRAARIQSQAALDHTNTEREQFSALYAQAQALAVDICDTVEFFYRKDPSASSRRVKCARWGVVYIFEPNETPDAPAADPAPTPPPNP